MTTNHKLYFYFNRRRLEYGLLQDPSSEISDQDLLSFVQEVKQTDPHCGIQMMCGRLRSRGYVVTRERVRNALRSLDPLYAVRSWPGLATKRRPYSVAGPNSLWHIGKSTLQTEIVIGVKMLLNSISASVSILMKSSVERGSGAVIKNLMN